MTYEVKPLQAKIGSGKTKTHMKHDGMELMINKNTHTYVLEVTGIMMMLMAVSCYDDHESMVEDQDTRLRAERPAVQLLCLLLHILYTSLYCTMTTSILCLHVRHHIKAATELDSSGHLASCELLTPMQLQTEMTKEPTVQCKRAATIILP